LFGVRPWELDQLTYSELDLFERAARDYQRSIEKQR